MTEQKMKKINAWVSKIDKNNLEMQESQKTKNRSRTYYTMDK